MSTIGEQEMLRNQEAKQTMLHEKKEASGGDRVHSRVKTEGGRGKKQQKTSFE